MKSQNLAFLAVGAAIIAGAVIFVLPGRRAAPPVPTAVSATQTADGQVIEIAVRDGYTPSAMRAKAGRPLILKFKTDGTLDCSVALRISAIGWSKNLPATGEVAVPVPPQPAGTTLTGACSMGMRSFRIVFE